MDRKPNANQVRVDLMRLRSSLNQLGWSYSELAERSGASIRTIERLFQKGTTGRKTYSDVLNAVREGIHQLNEMIGKPELLPTTFEDESDTIVSTDTVRVEIKIDREFASFSESDKRLVLLEIQKVLGIDDPPTDDGIRPGSVIIDLRLTPEQAEALYWAVERGELDHLDINQVSVHDSNVVDRDTQQIDDEHVTADEEDSEVDLSSDDRSSSEQTHSRLSGRMIGSPRPSQLRRPPLAQPRRVGLKLWLHILFTSIFLYQLYLIEGAPWLLTLSCVLYAVFESILVASELYFYFGYNTFRDANDVAESLGIPVLTRIPFFRGKRRKVKKEEIDPYKTLSMDLAVVHQPASMTAEAIRSLRTAVFFDTNEIAGGKVLQITSPLPGDGKSMIACNLAASIAQCGKRVLAIDCDLRRPQMTDNFGCDSKLGLTNVLNGECEPLDAAHSNPVPNLSVMPCGPIPSNPAETLSLPPMNHLLDCLREHFDFIILDTPPLLVVSDPSITASMADALILTLRIRRKSKPNAREALRILYDVGANVLGTVINSSDEAFASDESRGYGYSTYGYYTYERYDQQYYRRNRPDTGVATEGNRPR